MCNCNLMTLKGKMNLKPTNVIVTQAMKIQRFLERYVNIFCTENFKLLKNRISKNFGLKYNVLLKIFPCL
jgi:hypothetical protein